ncbi:hypothetical protein H072_9483 [Dactylellina haptotyla CBS 200.50]|uniref:Mitochondrial pyruvate carrier n=1 Tax=Dactylellina haptotyla (strain CBS 200.50) TaxID=1284197 RepID=S8BCH5_DACHA|nr:hypothetical protein H072_9483 [Dactylellina haptotyla CBS 200.50]
MAATTISRLWNSEVGLKTVHFWAPVMKWGLVIAGISDFYRPPEKLSLTQNLALTATGLAAVNFFLAGVGTVQVSRILMHEREQQRLKQDHPVLAELQSKAA